MLTFVGGCTRKPIKCRTQVGDFHIRQWIFLSMFSTKLVHDRIYGVFFLYSRQPCPNIADVAYDIFMALLLQRYFVMDGQRSEKPPSFPVWVLLCSRNVKHSLRLVPAFAIHSRPTRRSKSLVYFDGPLRLPSPQNSSPKVDVAAACLCSSWVH